MGRSPSMPRRPAGRFAAVAALAVAASSSLVTVTGAPAAAAAECVRSDPYSHQLMTPDEAPGGALASGAKFGAAMATGDFNKDGFADVAVGAPGDTVDGAASGAVYVFPGSATGTGAAIRLRQTAAEGADEAGDQFGAALAAGDFNKDGYADLAVGAPGEAIGTVKSGGSAVFYGKAAGLTTGKGYHQTAMEGTNEAGDLWGTALAAGDFNRDGYADLAVGVPGEAPDGTSVKSGTVAVLKGASGGLTRGWWIDQNDAGIPGANEAGDKFGAALAAGNITGSAHDDLAVGTPGEAPGDAPVSGGIYVITGAADGIGTGIGLSQSGHGGANEAGDGLGSAVAVGDFDDDGFADLAAGLPGEAPGDVPTAGSVLVYPGGSTAIGTGYWVQLAEAGETLLAGDKFGLALAAGDADADGHADLLVGAPGKSYPETSDTGSGVAVLFRGRDRVGDDTRALDPARRIAQADVVAGNESSDAFGSAVVFGDVNGDGRADGIVGSSGEAIPGNPRSGSANALVTLWPAAGAGLPVAQFSATAAGQATPAAGATIGAVDYAYADNIGRLLHGHQTDPDNTLSVQWTAIHGTEAFTGRPTLAEQADGRLHVMGLNATGSLWVRSQQTKTPPAWGGWVNLGGSVASPPVMARQSDGTLVAFAVDGAGALWAVQQQAPNAAYTTWLGLGLAGFTGPVTAQPLSDGVRIFARDTDGDLHTMLYSGAAVTDCAAVGDAPVAEAPAVVPYPGNRLRLFARTPAGGVVTMMQDTTGAFPAAWTPVGDFVAAGAAAALIDPVSGKTQVVARGEDGGVYGASETIQGSGEWTDWTRLNYFDEVAATDPTVLSLTGANGPTWAFVFRKTDNQTRIYLPTSAFAARARAADSRAFTGTTLPAPPR